VGYTTDFRGSIRISPPLLPSLVTYVNTLNGTRRVKRNLPEHFGVDGEFFVDVDGFDWKNAADPTILDYNKPPNTQPSLWCGWEISEDGADLHWDGGEKFYEYIPWLAYLMGSILIPLGCTMNGEIEWVGEDVFDDRGVIRVNENKITVKEDNGKLAYKVVPEVRKNVFHNFWVEYIKNADLTNAVP